MATLYLTNQIVFFKQDGKFWHYSGDCANYQQYSVSSPRVERYSPKTDQLQYREV